MSGDLGGGWGTVTAHVLESSEGDGKKFFSFLLSRDRRKVCLGVVYWYHHVHACTGAVQQPVASLCFRENQIFTI